eukprot:SAG31_NODE_20_length_34168_cov_33.651296_32_plen_166_part_00
MITQLIWVRDQLCPAAPSDGAVASQKVVCFLLGQNSFSLCAVIGPCWLATRELPPEPTLADVASEGAVQVVAARSRRCILKVLRLANGAAVAKLESSLHKLRSVSQAQATEQCRQAVRRSSAERATFVLIVSDCCGCKALVVCLSVHAAKDLGTCCCISPISNRR